MKKGKLIVISGFSGSGKGTIVNNLLQINNFKLSISATTRKKREYEIENEHYFFLSNEQFEQMIKNDELLEYAIYNNEYYGTPKKFVLDNLDSGINVLLEIEYQGALKIKKKFEDAILIFIITKTAKELYSRLKKRNTETDIQIKERMETSLKEITFINNYDYVVVNDTVEDATNDIVNILNNKSVRNFDYDIIINNLFKDLKEKNYV